VLTTQASGVIVNRRRMQLLCGGRHANITTGMTG
jgi:hypothetical protein